MNHRNEIDRRQVAGVQFGESNQIAEWRSAMVLTELKVPCVTSVKIVLTKWRVNDWEPVACHAIVCELEILSYFGDEIVESTCEFEVFESGSLHHAVCEGSIVQMGQVMGWIIPQHQ